MKLPPNPRILCIGTAELKNLRRLITAIKNLKCTLVIVGRIPTDISRYLLVNEIIYENY